MLKKCIFLLSFFLLNPAHAGNIENALKRGDNVFLYLYSPDCKYCTMFTPIYEKLTKTYNGQYTFSKVDTSTNYGKILMYQYQGRYVPYVVLINNKKNKATHITPMCLLDDVCLNTEIKQFRL